MRSWNSVARRIAWQPGLLDQPLGRELRPKQAPREPVDADDRDVDQVGAGAGQRVEEPPRLGHVAFRSPVVGRACAVRDRVHAVERGGEARPSLEVALHESWSPRRGAAQNPDFGPFAQMADEFAAKTTGAACYEHLNDIFVVPSPGEVERKPRRSPSSVPSSSNTGTRPGPIETLASRASEERAPRS
jgi:hypothetical protein